MRKLSFILLPFLLLTATLSFAQESDSTDDTVYEDESEYIDYKSHDMFRLLDTLEGQIGVYLASTPFMGQQSFGGGLDLQGWYTNSFAAGISLTITGRKVSPTFGYDIGQSLLTYYDISLFNEFKMLQRHRFEAAFRLYTGVSIFHLADNTIKERYTWYDEYGFAYEGERALPIANNVFMRVAPAFVLRYRVSRNVMIEGSAAYNFFVGGPKFGQLNDFNNYQLQLGIKANLR